VDLLHPEAMALGEAEGPEGFLRAPEEEGMAAAGVVVVGKNQVLGEVAGRSRQAPRAEAETLPERSPLCANMTETSPTPGITVEGEEVSCHVQEGKRRAHGGSEAERRRA
jgi:hypothetical protein